MAISYLKSSSGYEVTSRWFEFSSPPYANLRKDVPEMGYTNKDRPFPRGELCVRTPKAFSGYYNDDKVGIVHEHL